MVYTRQSKMIDSLIKPIAHTLRPILTSRRVPISRYRDDPGHLPRICPDLVKGCGTVVPSLRKLAGTPDQKYDQEWTEEAVLPDGRKCQKVYLFTLEDLQEDGNDLALDDYPWDDAHVCRILLTGGETP